MYFTFWAPALPRLHLKRHLGSRRWLCLHIIRAISQNSEYGRIIIIFTFLDWISFWLRTGITWTSFSLKFWEIAHIRNFIIIWNDLHTGHSEHKYNHNSVISIYMKIFCTYPFCSETLAWLLGFLDFLACSYQLVFDNRQWSSCEILYLHDFLLWVGNQYIPSRGTVFNGSPLSPPVVGFRKFLSVVGLAFAVCVMLIRIWKINRNIFVCLLCLALGNSWLNMGNTRLAINSVIQGLKQCE